MNIKKILYILIFIISINQIYAQNCGADIECFCGDTITSNYILNKSLSCNQTALNIVSGNLDCNQKTIKGKLNNIGISIQGRDNIIIKNCNFQNFSIAIKNDHRYAVEGFGMYNQVVEKKSDNTIINNNLFINNKIGIETSYSNKDLIYNNIFQNNSINSIQLKNSRSKVFNNTLNTKIYYSNTWGKSFCNNSKENKYINITGPKCDCIDLRDGLIIDSNVKVCKADYKTKNINMYNYGSIDCQNSIITGDKSSSAFRIFGKDNTKIQNCIIQNFNKAIEINIVYKKTAGGGYYTSDIINIKNNIIKNNTYGIYDHMSRKSTIENNVFKDNLKNAIYLDSTFLTKVFNNQLINNSIFYKDNYNINFCKNNQSNLYFKGSYGPLCTCETPFDNMKITTHTNFCPGTYKVKNIILEAGSINCQNSKLIGDNINKAIRVIGAENTIISNCNIQNYSYGISYEAKYIIDGRHRYYKPTRYNQVLNNTINNVDYGIFMNIDPWRTKDSYAENIHNNIIFANKLNIYNKISKKINASNNFFGILNNSEIEDKFFKKDLIIYKPKLKLNISNLNFKKENIILLNNKENNNSNQSLKLIINKNTMYPVLNLEITLIEIEKNQLKNQIKFNTNLTSFEKISEININYNFSKKNSYYLILNSNNKFNETNYDDNLIQVNLNNYNIYLESNSYSNLVDKEIKTYIKSKFKNNQFQDSKKNSNVEIVIGTKSLIKYPKLRRYFNSKNFFFHYYFKKPYEYSIISKTIENKKYIFIKGQDLEGDLAATRHFIENKEYFINNDINFTSNSSNRDAKLINNYIHSLKNEFDFKKDNSNFRNIIKNVLNNKKYIREELIVPIIYNNLTFNYSLIKFSPDFNINSTLNKTNYPIVLSGGLFSNKYAFENLAIKLSNRGKITYLIEMVGNKNIQYNYNYSDLIQTIYPTYINFILNDSKYNKIDYIGHSNGARVSLDSLKLKNMNQSINNLILLGVPGKFEKLSLFAKLINSSGKSAIEKMRNKNLFQITVARISHELDSIFAEILSPFIKLLDDNNRISLNLFNQYYNWISSNKDENPGINLSIKNFNLIYGDYLNSGNDLIVAVNDEEKIFENINSNNKKSYQYNIRHTDMTNNKNLMELIFKIEK